MIHRSELFFRSLDLPDGLPFDRKRLLNASEKKTEVATGRTCRAGWRRPLRVVAASGHRTDGASASRRGVPHASLNLASRSSHRSVRLDPRAPPPYRRSTPRGASGFGRTGTPSNLHRVALPRVSPRGAPERPPLRARYSCAVPRRSRYRSATRPPPRAAGSRSCLRGRVCARIRRRGRRDALR